MISKTNAKFSASRKNARKANKREQVADLVASMRTLQFNWRRIVIFNIRNLWYFRVLRLSKQHKILDSSKHFGPFRLQLTCFSQLQFSKTALLSSKQGLKTARHTWRLWHFRTVLGTLFFCFLLFFFADSLDVLAKMLETGKGYQLKTEFLISGLNSVQYFIEKNFPMEK